MTIQSSSQPSGSELAFPPVMADVAQEAHEDNGQQTSSAEECGLTHEEARQRLETHGPNRLPEPALPSIGQIFIRQFLSPFIYILLFAAIASYALGQMPNAVFIFIVLLINALIGTLQEFSAQRSAAALRNLVKGQAKVMRDGEVCWVDAETLVPGDHVLLESGDKIPADIALQQAVNLSVDESMLTGESIAVDKDAQGPTDEQLPLAERTGLVFAGTMTTRGRANGVVVATGLNTTLGKIAHAVASKSVTEAPLMLRVRRFTYQTAAAIFVAIVMLVALMLMRGGYSTESMVMMAIGLAVSTIPEGLPAALTVALSIGMRRMAQNNVIIRKLVAVEALGSCTFICSDKTGTLTVNEMTVKQVLLPNGQRLSVTGEGSGDGRLVDDEVAEHQRKAVTSSVESLCTTGVLANEATLSTDDQLASASGDIVDIALLTLAKKAGLSPTALRLHHPQNQVIPYESERAFSGSVNVGDDTYIDGAEPSSSLQLHVKGSPEKVVAMCQTMLVDGECVPLDREAIDRQCEQMASEGYRLLALATGPVENAFTVTEEAIHHLSFVGMVGMIDPIRPEAKQAVEKCQVGGIQVAMVTGDHPITALAIACDLGLCPKEAMQNPSQHVLTGKDIAAIFSKGADKADEWIANYRVFARIEPQQKQQIVESFMRSGHFVAVTGDGVNDAPALRQSHVGVAMGKRGTDVAKETAQLIITDDNFSSIVSGIEQGRIVYNNIRKVIALLIATGFSALLLFFLSVAAGLPMPLTALQLLWLNLVANGLQDVALAFEPGEGQELQAKPRQPNEPIFERHIVHHVLIAGGTMGVLAFLTFGYLNYAGVAEESARNLTLLLMVLFGNLHALSSRSETQSLLQMSWRTNLFLMMAVPLAQLIHISAMYLPGLNTVLGLQPVSVAQWCMLALVACVLLVVEEVHKRYLRHSTRA